MKVGNVDVPNWIIIGLAIWTIIVFVAYIITYKGLGFLLLGQY